MVNTETIKQALLDLQNTMSQVKDSSTSADQWATLMSQVITNAILSAQVNVGISVSTTGTATAQTGLTTSIGKLS